MRLASLLMTLASLCAISTTVFAEPYTVAGTKLDVTIVLDQPTIMVGEPTFFAYRVANLSDRNWKVMVGGDYRNRLGRPESFTVEVVREDGRKVPQPDAGFSMGGIGGAGLLPGKGHYDYSLFLPHWATFEEPGRYTIICRRKLELVPDDGADPFARKTNDLETTARATIAVVPADRQKFGELIARLGDQMLDRTREGYERAEKMLAEIRDERVIPFFAELAEKPHQSPRFTACAPLGRFNDDEAFEALRKLMKTTAEDVRNGSTTLELAESSAQGVRHAAIVAIAGSPHPKAIPFLWTCANEPYYGVRITILHKAAELKTPEARAIIQQMLKDENEIVRNEAARYWKALQAGSQ